MSDKKYTIKDWLEGRVGVRVSAEKEFNRLMDIAEENGVKWYSGAKAKGRIWCFGNEISIAVRRDSSGMTGMVWDYCVDDAESVRIDDILQDVCRRDLHITSAGNITHAVLKQDGKVIKRSMAACHPDDQYDFLTGARAALDRMQGKKPLSLEDVPTEKLVEELRMRNNVCVEEMPGKNTTIVTAIQKGKGKAFELLGPITIIVVEHEEDKSK